MAGNKRFREVPQREQDDTRINGMIRVPEIRLIGSDGELIGVMPTRDALALAEEKGFDLVELAGTAVPPVCRIMDYGKFKYEKSKKVKESKKKQIKVQNKEIKFHLKTDKHDYDFKIKHAISFLIKGNRVKVTLVFRGREIVYKDLAMEIMGRVDVDLGLFATAERKFVVEGRNMISNYLPDKKKIQQYERENASELKKMAAMAEMAEEDLNMIDEEEIFIDNDQVVNTIDNDQIVNNEE